MEQEFRDNKGKFLPGNPGRPKGARAKLSKRAFLQVEQNFDVVLGVLLAKAMSGDTDAIKILFSMVLPKDQPIELENLTSDHLIEEIKAGNVTPDESRKLATTLAKLKEIQDIDEMRAKIEQLEQALSERR